MVITEIQAVCFLLENLLFKLKDFVRVTYQSMWLGIRQVKAGAYLGDIGYAIQSYAESNSYSVVREFCGHGIGKVFHDEPQVLHYGISR